MKKLLFFVCWFLFTLPGYAQKEGNLSSRIANAVLQKTTIENVLKFARMNHLPGLELSVRFATSSYLAVNVKDEEGRTPLMWACQNGNLEMVHFLLQKGARVNTEDNHKRVALEYALLNRHDQIAASLVRANADVKRTVDFRFPSGEVGEDVSLFALSMILGEHQAAVEILKRDKRFFGSRMYSGWSILDLAVAHHFWVLADQFIEQGYVYSWHAPYEAFKAHHFLLFKTLVEYRKLGYNDIGYTLRALVQSDRDDALQYIQPLMKMAKKQYFGKTYDGLINFRGFLEDLEQTPFDLAVREDVRSFLWVDGGKSFRSLPVKKK